MFIVLPIPYINNNNNNNDNNNNTKNNNVDVVIQIGAGGDAWGFQWWDHVFNKAANNIDISTTTIDPATNTSAQQECSSGTAAPVPSSTSIQLKSKVKLTRSELVTTQRPTVANASSSTSRVFGTFVKSSE